MFGWLVKREISRPTSEFLLSEDFETLWSLPFRWCNREVPSVEPSSIPDEVKEVTYRLIRGFFKGNLNLRMPSGYKVQTEPLFFLLKDRNPWRNVLWHCLGQAQFDMTYLSKLYCERAEVLAWCEKELLTPPSFWVKNTAKEVLSKRPPLEDRLRNEEFDRLVCQAIARVYWDIDPNIHPAHMGQARAIRIYGNGKLYKDESTVKNWITEVDPRKGERKTGRPENIPYRIDLDTGQLAE